MATPMPLSLPLRFSVLLLAAGLTLAGCQRVKRLVVAKYPTEYVVQPAGPGFTPAFDGKDADRPRIDVRLVPAATGFDQITDLQFPPGESDRLVVLEKTGRAHHLHLSTGARGVLLEVPVLTASEQGLLGLAFHPRFAENGRFFINYTLKSDGKEVSRIEAWKAADPADLAKGATVDRTILEVEQPYPNHNAGQLAFGPDGMLYVGWGDGGWRADPHGHGQNPKTWLGSMLRIDVDPPAGGQPYAVPPDNPFVGDACCAPETFAYGLRNPWRYSFAPDGRLVVADVGQDRWEELDIVERGGNYGWNVLEGAQCFPPDSSCDPARFAPPFYTYGRDEGISITGGYVYTGEKVPALKGKYLFGDFATARIWAIDLPAPGKPGAPETMAAGPVHSLGRWPLLISTFGQDARGEIYVADFAGRGIYRIER